MSTTITPAEQEGLFTVARSDILRVVRKRFIFARRAMVGKLCAAIALLPSIIVPNNTPVGENEVSIVLGCAFVCVLL